MIRLCCWLAIAATGLLAGSGRPLDAAPPAATVSSLPKAEPTEAPVERLSGPGAVADEILSQHADVLSEMPPDAREKLTGLIRRDPSVWRDAIAKARARGWKPTANAAYSVGTRRGAKKTFGRILPISAQEAWQSDAGEALIWEWEDGDPNTIDMTVWVRSYMTEEEITADIQTEVSDDIDDIWERWHYVAGYRAGWKQEREDRESRGGLMPIGLIPASQTPCQQSCRCQRLECLRANLGRIFKSSLWRTKFRLGTAFTVCAVAARQGTPDARAMPIAYILCVASGVGAAADTLANMLEDEQTCGTCGNVPHPPAPNAIEGRPLFMSPGVTRACIP